MFHPWIPTLKLDRMATRMRRSMSLTQDPANSLIIADRIVKTIMDFQVEDCWHSLVVVLQLSFVGYSRYSHEMTRNPLFSQPLCNRRIEGYGN